MYFKYMRDGVFEETYIMYPAWVFPKVNGVHCFVRDNVLYSPALGIIKNEYIQNQFNMFEGFEGWLTLHGYRKHPDGNVFVAEELENKYTYPRVVFNVYDVLNDETALDFYYDRYAYITQFISVYANAGLTDNIIQIPYKHANTAEEFNKVKEHYELKKFSSLLVRSPYGLYHNRPADWLIGGSCVAE